MLGSAFRKADVANGVPTGGCEHYQVLSVSDRCVAAVVARNPANPQKSYGVGVFDAETGAVLKAIDAGVSVERKVDPYKIAGAVQLTGGKLIVTYIHTPCRGYIYNLETGTKEDFDISLPAEPA